MNKMTTKSKKMYGYNPETFEYSGEVTAYIDPLESEKQGEDIFIVPANATEKEPLTAEKNQINIWNLDTQEWKLFPDFRGQTVYKKATGETVKIEKVGTLPDDLTEKEYPDPYATWSDDFNNWWISPADGMRKQRDQAEVEKNRLITLAEQRVNDLSEATDESVFEPDEIDPADIELLKQWKRYRVFIKRVDTSALIISWPEVPE